MRHGTRLGLLVLLACAAAPSCKKGTYLEVVFKGAGLPPVNHIHFELTLDDGRVSAGDLPANAPAGHVVTLPASAAFQLDDFSGGLALSATAYDETNAAIAHATTSTTIMHADTWTVEVDFGNGGTTPDAGSDTGPTPDAGAADAADDGSSLVTVTDGSIDSGCVAVSVEASESVSLDYNSSGQDQDSGNMLWANLGPSEQYIGWMKFGVRFVPRTAHVSKATLNLFMAQASGAVPTLVVDYSPVDGWTRKSKASDVSKGGVISIGGPYLTPNAPPASTSYALDVTNHNWSLDFVDTDGTVTLGIENTTVASAAVASGVTFYGVDHLASPDPTRPTLDLEFCQ